MHRNSRGPSSPSSRLASGRTSLHFPGSLARDSRALRHSDLTARGILATRRQEMSNALVESAQGFPYSRILETHKSCVNALRFSSGDGRFLASGGDDLQICLWDFHQDDINTSSYTMRGPTRGNIFCLEFSSTNRYLYSGGTYERIYKYDIAYLGLPLSSITPREKDRMPDYVYRDNSDSIRALSTHPTNDEIFMSASEDGTVRRYDGRQDTRSGSAQDVIQMQNEVTDVKYNPAMEHYFATSDASGRVFLRDSRMAFTSTENRCDEGILVRYNTRITKRSATSMSNPESSSISFDRNGSKLAVLFMQYQPTIYSLSDPDPVAVLSGKTLPDGTLNPPNRRTYSNVCTMKHGSFGGPGLDDDDMYATGSDDFRGYVWKLPPVSHLLAQRKIVSADAWDAYDPSTIAFSEGRDKPKVLPVEISRPLCRLTGHDSIVNTAIFHPHFFHIVTAGVEKKIMLHSPTPSSPCTQNLQKSPTDVRELKPEDEDEDRTNYLTALLGAHPTLLSETLDDREERRTISLFDHIIRDENEADVFTRRAWNSDESDSETGFADPDFSESSEDNDGSDTEVDVQFLSAFLT